MAALFREHHQGQAINAEGPLAKTADRRAVAVRKIILISNNHGRRLGDRRVHHDMGATIRFSQGDGEAEVI